MLECFHGTKKRKVVRRQQRDLDCVLGDVIWRSNISWYIGLPSPVFCSGRSLLW